MGQQTLSSRSAEILRQKRRRTSVVTAIYPVNEDQDRLFLLQLLPSPEPAPEENATPKDATAESILQKQKLDCALQLARTVSLDFNNALTSILGHTSLLLTQADAKHPMRPSLLEVEKAAARAAEIASDLGSFSRQEKDARAQTARNLNSILQRAVQIFENSEGKRISWHLQLERKPFAAKSDEAKMQQAFAKILENAVQAIDGDGEISVQSRNVELDQGTKDLEVRLAPGTYVCVEITDSGCGIEKDVLPRIFEPFYTTKGGKHRGLGLALVYGIVTNHGGAVAVASDPGNGTSVRLYLPAEKRVVSDQTISGDLKGNQTVLIVDDEDLMLTLGQTVLSAFGYEVLTANSGQKAIDMLTNGKKKIDLVITDLVMPGMSGRELVDQVRKISPEMRVLSTSGYVPPANQTDDATYIQKPFTSQELLAKVKQVLAA